MSHRHLPRATPGALACVLLAGAPAMAADPFVLAVDVPSDLAGSQATPGQIALNQSNVYSLIASYPEIGALQSPVQGVWYLAFAVPTMVGGFWAEPRDVVATDGSSFSIVFDGSAQGLPEGARIDALALDPADPSGFLGLSFDVPVQIAGLEYGPSDVVAFAGGAFLLIWSGADRGVPPGANLTGLDGSPDGPVMSFDIPVTLGGASYPPGSLVVDNGGVFVLGNLDPAWPAGSQLRDFAFVTGAGSIAESGVASLDVTYDGSGGMMTLSWGASCASNDADFEVYEGVLAPGAAFAYNHEPLYCSTGGATAVTFTPPGGSSYFLVVPQNGVFEGSYGMASTGAQIPPGGTSCRPQLALAVCQ